MYNRKSLACARRQKQNKINRRRADWSKRIFTHTHTNTHRIVGIAATNTLTQKCSPLLVEKRERESESEQEKECLEIPLLNFS